MFKPPTLLLVCCCDSGGRRGMGCWIADGPNFYSGEIWILFLFTLLGEYRGLCIRRLWGWCRGLLRLWVVLIWNLCNNAVGEVNSAVKLLRH